MTMIDKTDRDELLDQLDAETEKFDIMAAAFGWTRPAIEAPSSTEICRAQAEALRRAVAAIIDNRVPIKPTPEQKKAVKLFINAGDESLTDDEINLRRAEAAIELCRYIAMLEAIKIPFDLSGKTPDADGRVTLSSDEIFGTYETREVAAEAIAAAILQQVRGGH